MHDHTDWNDPAGRQMDHPGGGLDLWGMVMRGKWLILLGVAAGLGVAHWRFQQEKPVYQSRAKILVTETGNELPLPGLNANDQRRYGLERQVVLIRSGRIVERAVKIGELQASVDRIIGGLNVRLGTDGVLDMSYAGGDPEDCRVVLDAVISGYDGFLRDMQKDDTTETKRLIEDAKTVLGQQLAELTRKYREFRQNAPGIWSADGQTVLARQQLVGLESSRLQLFQKRKELEAEAYAIERALEQGGSREAIAIMAKKLADESDKEGIVTENKSLNLTERIWPLLLKRHMLLEQVGPAHQSIKALDRQIEFIEQMLYDQQEQDPTVAAKPKKDFVTVYLESLREQAKVLEIQEAELNRTLIEERKLLKGNEDLLAQDQDFQKQIENTEKLFDVIVEKLSELNLVQNVGGFQMEVIHPAERGSQIAPNFARTMTMGGVLGAVFGLLLAFIRQAADKRFTAPQDVQVQLGAPVVGHIPNIPITRRFLPGAGDDEGIQEQVICFHQPGSRFAESFRAVRVALYFNTRGEGHKVVQVTSPSPGDGKSTLAANLAVSVANSGKRVLLVEADLRRPRVHEIFGLDDSTGLVPVLRGEMDLLEAVQSTEVENLWCLACGERPANPSELLTSVQFEHFLQVVREKYDYVIVDTPPVLAVTDASVVAAKVDGVFMVIRLKKNSRATASRAAEILSSVGARILGVVVNGAGQNQAYGYGKYGKYSSYRGAHGDYAAGYDYGYGYGYEEPESKQYYPTEQAEVPARRR